MVFCNLKSDDVEDNTKECHNPYFSRWFSAIPEEVEKILLEAGHNPYFSRWFSAIEG